MLWVGSLGQIRRVSKNDLRWQAGTPRAKPVTYPLFASAGIRENAKDAVAVCPDKTKPHVDGKLTKRSYVEQVRWRRLLAPHAMPRRAS